MPLNYQNLRSGTANKRPNPAALADGQIAVQFNETDPAIYFKGNSGALIKVAPTYVGTTAPNASPASGGQSGNSAGETWLDTSTTPPTLKIYDGSNFVASYGYTDIDVVGKYTQSIVAVPALDIDCSAGNYFTKTINANSAFTFSNVPTGKAYSFILELTHTSGTVTWPGSVKFPGNTAPSLTIGKTHLFVFITDDGGARFRAASLVDYDN